jgi:hypothetical protein
MNIAEQLWKQAWKFEILYDIVCKAKNFTDVDAGYLYSLNASTLDSSWQMMEPLFRETVASFHLNPPTDEYVPPYKDPWRFW